MSFVFAYMHQLSVIAMLFVEEAIPYSLNWLLRSVDYIPMCLSLGGMFESFETFFQFHTIFTLILFAYIYVYTYLKGRVIRKRHKERSSIPWLTPQIVLVARAVWTEAESQKSLQDLSQWVQGPKDLSCTPLVSKAKNRELDWKWNNHDIHWHLYEVPAPQRFATP